MNQAASSLRPLSEVLQFLLDQARPPLALERCALLDAAGRVLGRAVQSSIDVPGQDVSSMDGYAVRTADCPPGGVLLRLAQRIPAGSVGQALLPGQAARIFTGAPLPPGADAVVMQEHCTTEGEEVRLERAVQRGAWIRRVGEDVRSGALVLESGTRMRAQEMGLAASLGVSEVWVARQPRVALFSTGNELLMPGEPLRPGAIYNANRFTLRALLEACNCAVTDLGNVPDDIRLTRHLFREASRNHDLLLSSGGVSVGEEDHVKPAVEAEGRLMLWRVAIKPGKPLAFGHVGPAAFLGLPGNPVATLVTFMLLVKPFLLRMQGARRVEPLSYWMRADFARNKADSRQEFLRVRINTTGGLDAFPNQSSGVLSSAVWGDGLADVPAGSVFAPGALLRFLPFSELLF